MRTRKGREPEYVRRLAGESTPKSGEPQRAQREAGRPAAVQVASLPASHRSAAPSWLNSQISVQSSVFRSTTGSAAARAGATSGLPGAAHVVRARRAEANESTQRAGFRRPDARSIRRGNGAVANSRFMATAAGDRCADVLAIQIGRRQVAQLGGGPSEARPEAQSPKAALGVPIRGFGRPVWVDSRHLLLSRFSRRLAWPRTS